MGLPKTGDGFLKWRMSATEWQYLKKGHLVHAVIRGPYDPTWASMCNIDRPAEDWFGTGTQDEYERAAKLPLCVNCLRALGLGAHLARCQELRKEANA